MKLSIVCVFIIKAAANSADVSTDKFLRYSNRGVELELVTAVHLIIEEVFLKRFTTVNIVSAVKNPEDHYYLSFRDALMAQNKGFSIYRLDNFTHIQSVKTRLKIYNVILLDNYETFSELNKNIVPDIFDFRGCYLIVLINQNTSGISEIFDAMWKKSIINVNVIFTRNDEVVMFLLNPFANFSCGNTSLHDFDTYKSGMFTKGISNAFANRLRDLQNCEIRLTTFHRCPASCVKVDKKSGNVSVSGFDIGIIDVIAERLKFKLTKEILLGEEQWGNVVMDQNGKVVNTTGAINRIVKNETDIIIGNYLLRTSRTLIMDSSLVYFSFPVVFAIPFGERLTGFEKLIRPFDLIVWVFMGIFISSGLLIILIINIKAKNLRDFVYGTRMRHAVVNMVEVIFGQSQNKLPKRNFSRYLLMMFLLFCLVQRSVYQGRLFIFLQTDGRHKEVQSIDEMVEKEFDFYMFESYTDILSPDSKVSERSVRYLPHESIKINVFYRRKIVKTEKDLIFSKPLEEGVRSAFMTSMTDIIYRNQQTYKSFVLKVCKEELLTTNIVMYYPKSFYLKGAIDDKLSALSASGILEHWTQKYVDLRFYNVKQQESGPKSLQVQHIFGIVNIWLIGCALGIFVFFMELGTSRFKENFYGKLNFKKMFLHTKD